MKILPATFQANLDPALPVYLIIERLVSFRETGGLRYLPGEFPRITCTVESDVNFSIGEISDLPATDNVDINYLTYQVKLIQKKGKTEIPVKFYFEKGTLVSKIRIPKTPNGEITWDEIRMNSMAGLPIDDLFRQGFTSEQALATFVRRSQIDAVIAELIANAPSTTENPILSGGGFNYGVG